MKKVVIIRYCEIHLKGKNRGYFQNMLIKNIKRSLRDINCKIETINTRYLIEDFDDNDYDIIAKKLKKIAGIHSFSLAYWVESDMQEIADCCKKIAKDLSGSFKVVTNRADKNFALNSMQISREIGGVILDNNSNLTVDVVNPENVVSIDVREGGKTLIFTHTQKGVGGMPVGSAGRGMLMLSGGIDSPVAGYLLAKRGMKIDAIHFFSYPYTSELAKEKVITLANKLTEYAGDINLYMVKFTKIQEEIHEKCPEELMITMMRRFMMRIAQRISGSCGAQAIITGESLGQVASQTIESITSSNSVVTMPVLRPLIAMDKLEIIEVSKKIETYDTSILPYEDCCTVFLPKFPAIKPKMEVILKAENKLDVDKLIEDALAETELFKI